MVQMAYMGSQTFLSILDRVSAVFEKEEFQETRQIKVAKEEVCVKFTDADIGWGFKVATAGQSTAQATKAQIALEEVSEP